MRGGKGGEVRNRRGIRMVGEKEGKRGGEVEGKHKRRRRPSEKSSLFSNAFVVFRLSPFKPTCSAAELQRIKRSSRQQHLDSVRLQRQQSLTKLDSSPSCASARISFSSTMAGVVKFSQANPSMGIVIPPSLLYTDKLTLNAL